MQLFVCADSRDEKQIQRLLTSVRRLNHRVWKSPFRAIISTQSWAITFEKIRNCDLFVFALTSQSLDSYRCWQQYAYAYNLKKNVLIVRLEDVGIITRPSTLNEFTAIEYTVRNSSRSKDLAKAIGELTCVPSLPMPLPPEPIVYTEGEPLLWTLSLSEIEYSVQQSLLLELKHMFQDLTDNQRREYGALIRAYFVMLSSHENVNPDIRTSAEEMIRVIDGYLSASVTGSTE